MVQESDQSGADPQYLLYLFKIVRKNTLTSIFVNQSFL